MKMKKLFKEQLEKVKLILNDIFFHFYLNQ